jgi:hypothetical protein
MAVDWQKLTIHLTEALAMPWLLGVADRPTLRATGAHPIRVAELHDKLRAVPPGSRISKLEMDPSGELKILLDEQRD